MQADKSFTKLFQIVLFIRQPTSVCTDSRHVGNRLESRTVKDLCFLPPLNLFYTIYLIHCNLAISWNRMDSWCAKPATINVLVKWNGPCVHEKYSYQRVKHIRMLQLDKRWMVQVPSKLIYLNSARNVFRWPFLSAKEVLRTIFSWYCHTKTRGREWMASVCHWVDWSSATNLEEMVKLWSQSNRGSLTLTVHRNLRWRVPEISYQLPIPSRLHDLRSCHVDLITWPKAYH